MSFPPPFEATALVRALTLRERIELARRAPLPAPRDAGLGARRLERLRSRRPFSDPAVFAEWLERNGWTEPEILAGLDLSPEALAGRLEAPPPWWAALARAYGEPVRPDVPPVPPDNPTPPQVALARLFYPLVVPEADRVQAEAETLVAEHPGAPFEPGRAVGLMLNSLVDRLFELGLRTLVLELHVARVRGQLEGESAEERFRSFVRKLRHSEVAIEILSEYPVLARLAVEVVSAWGRFSRELLRHLAEDRPRLERAFGRGASLGVLHGLQGGAGDIHRGGRSVHLLDFDSGVRIVYKPRPLSVDRHFQELLAWLNSHGEHPPFRSLEVVDRATHGWVELVEAGPCSSEAEVGRFYERQGGYLALLYMLDANDFHFENLIAAGEHPVLIDLESLFAQRLHSLNRDSAPGMATEAISYSVLRTGLLPRPPRLGDRFQNLDTSGLGGAAGQIGPAITAPDDLATDRMRVTRRELPFGGGENRPTLDGEEVRVLDHAAALKRGFEGVYRTLQAHRDKLLAPDGPLSAFADDEVRIILRPTQTYRMLHLDGLHPDLLRDALERDRHFDRLWLGVGKREEMPFVVSQERRELEGLDVPMFSSRPGRRHLYSGTGARLSDFFDVTGIEVVAARLAGFGERDRELQSWMIGASLAAMDSPLVRAGRAAPGDLDAREPATPERLLAAAVRVRDRLGELALMGRDGGVSWVGIAATDEQHFAPMPLGLDLYSGLPGIALFLAHLGEVAGDREARELAEATWRTVEAGLEVHLDDVEDAGLFTGLGGSLYLALELARLWRRPALIEVAEWLTSTLSRRIEQDENLDVISGSAGCIPLLLALHRLTGDPSHRELAVRAGDRILAGAREMPRGIGWIYARAAERPLSGFSHGAAGFAWALLVLARATGEQRFAQAARAALEYESSLFDPAEKNWRDVRTFHGPDGGFSVAWCHGAVGIGLARMACLDLEDDPAERAGMRRDLDLALETTVDFGFALDHSLCHGAMGTLEILAEAGRRLGRADHLLRAGQAADAICEEIEAGRFHCGVPGGYETPGLMDGLAGIGYGLLRLAAPGRVPSVLVLEAPVEEGAEIAEPRRETAEAEATAA